MGILARKASVRHALKCALNQRAQTWQTHRPPAVEEIKPEDGPAVKVTVHHDGLRSFVLAFKLRREIPEQPACECGGPLDAFGICAACATA